MRVISKKTLRKFWSKHPDSEQPLRAWYAKTKFAAWKTSSDIKNDYRNASFVANNRVIFNIKGNKYRLVAIINYDFSIVYIRFVRTHKDYNNIDAATIWGDIMNIKPVKTDSDYTEALQEVESLMGAKINTPEGDKLDVLVTLIESYEKKHHPILPPEPVEAIIHHMESQGLSRKDLEPVLGSRARVSEILSRKRSLSLNMIRKIQKNLGISAEILIKPYNLHTP